MPYQLFKDSILKRLQQDFPNIREISVQKIKKNNGCILDGLLILEGDTNITPTLYLNHYYAYYQDGHSFAETYNRLLSHYQANKATQRIDEQFFTDFENMRPHVVFKLIHAEKNSLLLREIPHLSFLDLAIVFYIHLPIDTDLGNATIQIRNEHLALWGQTTNSIYQIAQQNTQRLLPHMLKNINDMMLSLMPDFSYPTFPKPEDPLFPMYILTNTQHHYGASCLLYDNVLSSCAEKFQNDFYILPSSIHEVILVPAFEEDQLESFSGMVRQVNQTEVSPDEVLCDHAYFYSKAQNRILY